MTRITVHGLAAAFLLAGITAAGQAQTLISDNFEVDSSADYTVVDDGNAASGDGTPDSTIDFAFDYIAAGLPLAPNSQPGDVGGLRLAANETGNDAGAADHITAFNNLSINEAAYLLEVDIYMGVESAGGTTEFAKVGIGGSSNDYLSIFTPIVDNGHFISMTGEGGSSSDYRHSEPGNPAVITGDPSYLNSDNTTNATGDTYQAIFPDTQFPGSPGNSWTTMSILVTPSIVRYSLDGTSIIETNNLGSDGLVGLGYADAFSSVGPHFVVFDNLNVTVIPEPATMGLIGLGITAVCGASRRR